MKNRGDNILKNAEKQYHRKNYPAVIRILEPQVFRFRESYLFYYLLGMSCLYTSDFGGAFSFLQRGLQLRKGDIACRLGIAVVHLKRRDTSLALQSWLSVVDSEPGNRCAAAGLNYLRKNPDPDAIYKLFDSGRYTRFLPSTGVRIPVWVWIVIPVLVLTFLAWFFQESVREWFLEDWQRPETAAFELDFPADVTDDEADHALYAFSDKEIKQIFDNARRHFDNYEDNLAMLEINRIRYSNAAQDIKNTVELMMKALSVPKFGSLKTNFTIEEVLAEPLLYDGCYVAWKGVIANLNITEEAIFLDLLVGYETGRVLKHTVPVIFPFAELITENQAYEILGKIRIVNNRVSLEGTAIHILNP